MGKSVVVTGSTGGIGRAIVFELAGAGYEVIAAARNPELAEDLRAEAAQRGTPVRTVLFDVTDEGSTREGMAEIGQLADGGPWALVNNAGFAQAGTVEDVDDEAARYQLEVNLLAPARLARLALPVMRARGDGRIVMVSSVAGRVSLPLMGWYCASKHGLEALTDALRIEVADFGVKVSLIEPGSFGSNIWAEASKRLPEPATPEYARAYARTQTATGRSGLLPDPVWVARTVRLALGSPVPLPRYLVGADAVGGVIAETVVPTPVTDLVKGVSVGLRRVPFLPFGK